jgi:uncharacterized protein DUF4383
MSTALARLERWTPAQLGAFVFGVWWIGNGLAVFLASQSSLVHLSADGTVKTLGLSIAVNGWHGLFHLATGLAGVACCWGARSARAYALVVGVLYLAAALCGLLVGDTVFGVVRVDEIGSLDHAVEAVVMLAAWLASPRGGSTRMW